MLNEPEGGSLDDGRDAAYKAISEELDDIVCRRLKKELLKLEGK